MQTMGDRLYFLTVHLARVLPCETCETEGIRLPDDNLVPQGEPTECLADMRHQ